jgi:hypothetical protein
MVMHYDDRHIERKMEHTEGRPIQLQITLEKLEPWVLQEEDSFRMVNLVRLVLRHERALWRCGPWLPFPQPTCKRFGEHGWPLCIGVLSTLWSFLPEMTGRCPECGGWIYGYGFFGHLHQEGILGACLRCEGYFRRSVVGEEGRLNQKLQTALYGTEFQLGDVSEEPTQPPAKPLLEELFSEVRLELAQVRLMGGDCDRGTGAFRGQTAEQIMGLKMYWAPRKRRRAK